MNAKPALYKQHELDAADMHLYRNGNLEPEPVEAYSIVRIFTGPGRREFVEVRAHSSGWVEVTGADTIVVKPVGSNSVMVKPERSS
jgi:hypothetical protein